MLAHALLLSALTRGAAPATGGVWRRGGRHRPAAKVTEPAQRCAGVRAHFPSRCTGAFGTANHEQWGEAELRREVPAFAAAWAKRPISKDGNAGGMHANHAFALWFLIRKLKPAYLIESGVFRGFTTWLMRTAAPSAYIVSLDPWPCLNVPVRREHHASCGGRGNTVMTFRDQSPRTTYLVGDRFVEFAANDWDAHIPRDMRSRTLVMFDDHMSAHRHLRDALRHGFEHIFYEDNFGGADGDAEYSFNHMCTPAKVIATPADIKPRFSQSKHAGAEAMGIKHVDRFGSETTMLTLAEHNSNVAFLNQHLLTYFEFPALYDGCPDKGAQQSLYAEFDDLKPLGFEAWDPSLGPAAGESWAHMYPAYVHVSNRAATRAATLRFFVLLLLVGGFVTVALGAWRFCL